MSVRLRTKGTSRITSLVVASSLSLPVSSSPRIPPFHFSQIRSRLLIRFDTLSKATSLTPPSDLFLRSFHLGSPRPPPLPPQLSLPSLPCTSQFFVSYSIFILILPFSSTSSSSSPPLILPILFLLSINDFAKSTSTGDKQNFLSR